MSSTLITLLTFGGVILAGLLMARPFLLHHVDAYHVRLRPRRSEDASSAEKPRDSVVLSCLSTIGQVFLTSFPNMADRRTVELLTMANYRTPQHLAILIGIKGSLAMTVVVIACLSTSGSPMFLLLSVPAGIAAWMVPNFFLAGRVRKRQQMVLRELPIVIDLLLVCAQAGLGLLGAIDKVAKETEETCPTLASELKQLINDVKLFAKSVPIAMKELGERCGVDELINLAAALIAAESKGADISYPLRQQADALRDRLKRKKEEEAGKVPVKMVPVIMIFVMPLILAPMLGPAVVTIIIALEPIMRGLR